MDPVKQLIEKLGKKYGFEVSGLLCPVAYFSYGRFDGNYDGDRVFVRVDKSKRPDTGLAYYFPPSEKILTRQSTDEEIKEALRLVR